MTSQTWPVLDPAAPAAFTRALDDLLKTGRSTPCIYASRRGDHRWTSHLPVERAAAAAHCHAGACPVLDLCQDAAVAEGEGDHVRGGLDFGLPEVARAVRRAHRQAAKGAA